MHYISNGNQNQTANELTQLLDRFQDQRLPAESFRTGIRNMNLGEEIYLACYKGYTLLDCMNEIDQLGQVMHGRSIFHPEAPELKKGSSCVSVPFASDTYYGIIPIVTDTADRYSCGNMCEILADRFLPCKGLLTNYTMEDVLLKLKIDWVPREVLAVAAGAYRLNKGFPKHNKIGLGHSDDYGDLFRGHVVMCKSSYSIGTYSEGVVGFVHGTRQPSAYDEHEGISLKYVADGLTFKYELSSGFTK